MRSSLLFALIGLAALAAAPRVGAQASDARAAAAVAQRAEADLVRRIERWFEFWAAGRIDLDATLPKPALTERIYGAGVVPEQTQRPLRHRDALERMLDGARASQTAAVTVALLQLAAVGLDGDPVDARRSPRAVRGAAHAVLAELSTPAAIDALVEAAGPGERDLGRRVAALHALGAVRPPVARVFAERHLGDAERLVRLAAAEAVAARAHRDSLDDLTARIDAEHDAVVLQGVVVAVQRILRERGAEVDATAALQATLGAVGVLDRGGAGDWRTDLAIVELLMDARTARAIPALIDVLARFDRAGGRTQDSTILRGRAHSVLESLTGTRIRAEDVAGWRTFWEHEGDGFAVAPRVERRGDAGATTTGFFGIPIRGSRVVFVIDVSGSMKTGLAPFDDGTTSTARREPASRLAWAKRELLGAVASLPSDARFGVVVFASGVDSWGKTMLPPNPEVRSALRGMLTELMPAGGTNLWGALDRALGVSDAAYGEIDADGADEVFLLTDGYPSAGTVTSPDEIVAAVRDANRYRRVRIHAVSLGGDGAFLRQLAEQNGGTFVRR